MKNEQKCHTLFAPCCDTLNCINGVCKENGKRFGNTKPVVIQEVTKTGEFIFSGIYFLNDNNLITI